MYANTRTTYTNAACGLLAWQMPYHVEHHAFPAVPFHALRRVNELIRSRIEMSAPGYLGGSTRARPPDAGLAGVDRSGGVLMCGRYVSPDEAAIEREFNLVHTEWQFPAELQRRAHPGGADRSDTRRAAAG